MITGAFPMGGHKTNKMLIKLVARVNHKIIDTNFRDKRTHTQSHKSQKSAFSCCQLLTFDNSISRLGVGWGWGGGDIHLAVCPWWSDP